MSNQSFSDNEIHKLAFENLAGAIIISAIDGNWMYANKAALNLYGMTHEELAVGVKEIFKKVHSNDPYVKEMNDLIDGKTDSFTVIKISKLAHGNKWFKNEVARITSSDGSSFVIASITDVSELQEKLDELTRLNELMVNREIAMIELKNKIRRLES